MVYYVFRKNACEKYLAQYERLYILKSSFQHLFWMFVLDSQGNGPDLYLFVKVGFLLFGFRTFSWNLYYHTKIHHFWLSICKM